MSTLFLVGWTVGLWLLAVALVRLTPRARARRDARLAVAALSSRAGDRRAVARGQITATGEPLDGGPWKSKVVALTQWASVRRGTLRGAVVATTEMAAGLSLTTDKGSVALSSPLQVSIGHYADLKLGASTSLFIGDRVIALVPKAVAVYRTDGNEDPRRDDALTEILVDHPPSFSGGWALLIPSPSSARSPA